MNQKNKIKNKTKQRKNFIDIAFDCNCYGQ